MMQKKGGLGRGLSSLIPSFDPKQVSEETKTRKPASGREVIDAPIDEITPNPEQPRESFSHEEMEELIASIKEHGIIQPLILSPLDEGYEIIAGERRWRAAKMAGMRTVPSIVRTVKEHEKLELALIENIQRQDLNPIEEAKAYKKLINEFGMTQEAVAKKVGKSRPQVANFVRLLELPLEIQESVAAGEMPYTQARTLLALDNKKAQVRLFRKIVKHGFTVRDTEKRVGAGKRSDSGRDVEVLDKEERLRQALGTKVFIKKRGQAGNITIDFYSDEELNNLVDRISEM